MAGSGNATLSLEIPGLDALLSDVKGGVSALPNLLFQAMVASTNTVADDAMAVKSGRFKNQTGNLRRNIFRRVDSYAQGVVYVGSGAPYGVYVEFGTGPHIIMPVRRRVLADQRANIIFGTIVHHPGSQPYPFMQPAIDDNRDKVQQIYADMSAKLVSMMGGN